MKKKGLLILGLVFGIIIITILACLIFYKVNLKAVSNDSSEVDFMVDSGSTYYSVISKLKSNGLIKNELVFKVYLKLNNISKVEAGTYKLNKNMSVQDIVKIFNKGNIYNPDAIVITFKEGLHMRSIAKEIALNTNNTEDDVYNLLKDREYLNNLVNKYWFIDESILNNKLYYPLEGYLYPNTYEYKNKDVSVQDIFKTMLDEMEKQLVEYKTDLQNSKYSIHEILTLASIIELEGANSTDREGISGVFYNRLNNHQNLGSDVTTYYASKIDMNERDLYKYEIDDPNDYNTRSSHLAGKLPIGPISNPNIESIKAVLYPKTHDYFFFVADKTGKTYFSKTYQEHLSIRDDLKKAGLWYNYE